ncbi:MAG: MBL fold metallo-hydrolase [Almyronema sp.]
MSGRGSLLAIAELVCHCLLIETEVGLVLVDTGLGLDDVQRARSRLPGSFLFWANPRLDPQETALRQVERLGYCREDVRHILVTHLDFDHAGGIYDFPQAKVHVLASEYQAATTPDRWINRFRYRGRQSGRSPNWIFHEAIGEPWFGFEAIRPLPEVSTLLFIPLQGHSWGHAGVAVQTDQGWLLHAGDAYFFRDEIHAHPPYCPIGLRLFQACLAADRQARRHNQQRLRQLAAEQTSVQIFSAHDPVEFYRFSLTSA